MSYDFNYTVLSYLSLSTFSISLNLTQSPSHFLLRSFNLWHDLDFKIQKGFMPMVYVLCPQWRLLLATKFFSFFLLHNILQWCALFCCCCSSQLILVFSRRCWRWSLFSVYLFIYILLPHFCFWLVAKRERERKKRAAARTAGVYTSNNSTLLITSVCWRTAKVGLVFFCSSIYVVFLILGALAFSKSSNIQVMRGYLKFMS